MKKVSVTVTDLGRNTKKVLALIKDGVPVVVMMHNRPVAVMYSPVDVDLEIMPAWNEVGRRAVEDNG